MRSAPDVTKSLLLDDAWRIGVEASLWTESQEVNEWIGQMYMGQSRTNSFRKVLKYAYEQGAATGFIYSETKYCLFPKWIHTVKFWLTSYLVMLVYKWKENWRINHAECYDP